MAKQAVASNPVAPTLDPATRTRLEARAKRRFEGTQRQIKALAESNQHLSDSSGYTATAYITVDAYAAYSVLDANPIQFSDGTSASFSGTSWGVGLGDLIAGAVGQFAYDGPSLASMGTVTFVATFIADGGGGLQVVWWNSSTYLGELTAAGVGDGGGVFTGTGTFSSSS